MERQSPQRITSGVPGFDEVAGGGLPSGRVHVLKGAAGTGKTVLANQICFHGAAAGASVLYVTLLTELHEALLRNLSTFAFFDRSLVGRALRYLSFTGPFQERGLSGLMQELRRVVRESRPAVLVLDGFFPLAAAGTPTVPVSTFLQDLAALASLAATTALLTDSTPAGVHAPVHVLADGIIELEEALAGARARRSLRICKLRGTTHLGGLHTFSIDQRGLRVSSHRRGAANGAPDHGEPP